MLRPLLILTVIFESVGRFEGCSSNCPTYHYKPHSDRTEILNRVPQRVNLSELSLIGTRLSAVPSYQDLSITEQLKYGVRVLDISVRATSNKFAIHNKITFLNRMFGDVLKEVEDFLQQHPRELVIMLLDEVYGAARDVTKSNCKILEDYMRWNIVTNWSLDDNIFMRRGSILLGTIKDNSFKECTVNLNSQCLLSSELKKKYRPLANEISQKRREMTALQNASFGDKHYRCFVNIIGDYVHDKYTARYVALKGVGGLHLTCKEPINYSMANHFESPMDALIIVLADFPTQELIDRINDKNYGFSWWKA